MKMYIEQQKTLGDDDVMSPKNHHSLPPLAQDDRSDGHHGIIACPLNVSLIPQRKWDRGLFPVMVESVTGFDILLAMRSIRVDSVLLSHPQIQD
jgi:hypothetical protein